MRRVPLVRTAEPAEAPSQRRVHSGPQPGQLSGRVASVAAEARRHRLPAVRFVCLPPAPGLLDASATCAEPLRSTGVGSPYSFASSKGQTAVPAWQSEKCPGSGKPPSSSQDLELDGGKYWTVARCAVCGRDWCAVTRSGMVRTHKRWHETPRLEDVATTVRAAQELLTEAMKQLEKLEADGDE
jgi:hypothetical protein